MGVGLVTTYLPYDTGFRLGSYLTDILYRESEPGHKEGYYEVWTRGDAQPQPWPPQDSPQMLGGPYQWSSTTV